MGDAVEWVGTIGYVNEWTKDGRIIKNLTADNLPVPLRTVGLDGVSVGIVSTVAVQDDGRVIASGTALAKYVDLFPAEVAIVVSPKSGDVWENTAGRLVMETCDLSHVVIHDGSGHSAWPGCRINLVTPVADPGSPADAGLYPDGTGGHTHAPASINAAITSGLTRSYRQKQIHDALTEWGDGGATWRELDADTNLGHAIISGALTRLHRGGYVSRLEEQRHGCHIYVTAGNEGDRPTVPYRPQVGATVTEHATVRAVDVRNLVGQLRAAWPGEEDVIIEFLTYNNITVKED